MTHDHHIMIEVSFCFNAATVVPDLLVLKFKSYSVSEVLNVVIELSVHIRYMNAAHNVV